MLPQNILIWNVRGLNSRARRDVVREFVAQESATVACLVETKTAVMSAAMANDLMGMALDYVCLPAVGASGVLLLRGELMLGLSPVVSVVPFRSRSVYSRWRMTHRHGR